MPIRKMPFRADNKITQEFNSGIVTILSVSDGASPGRLPVETLTDKYSLRYEEMRLGINRLYLSRQNQIEIARVIRVQRLDITTQDVAITEDGKKYRIDTVQAVDDVYPASLDLSLVKFEQNGGGLRG